MSFADFRPGSIGKSQNKHRNILTALILLTSMSSSVVVQAQTSVFINELHYDNTGTDSNEAVEIADGAGTDRDGRPLVGRGFLDVGALYCTQLYLQHADSLVTGEPGSVLSVLLDVRNSAGGTLDLDAVTLEGTLAP